MELRHIRYFQAVAQTLNFTRAAERLNIAQPPLSRQIQQLEEHLGTALLERSRPLQLTEAGRFFYEQSDTLLKQLEQLCENTRRIGRGQRQWLGIGFAPSTLYAVLPELIRELRRDTDLELGLQEMTTLQQIEALKSGRIDIGFGRIHFDDAAIHQEVLREDPLVAVLPVGHHLIGQPITLERLSKERFVLYPANLGPVTPTMSWRCSPTMAWAYRYPNGPTSCRPPWVLSRQGLGLPSFPPRSSSSIAPT